ncbi:hypothetical protein ACGFXB_45610 [Streptomyces canus]|jgi:hypothetical protein|uniref:hypothetical protein n=1 Tax=Streptomyces canus TaxID=58343 RepID=UPI003724480C
MRCEVTVDCDTLTLTDRDQYLVLYSAPPGSPGTEALALLNVLGTEASQGAVLSVTTMHAAAVRCGNN